MPGNYLEEKLFLFFITGYNGVVLSDERDIPFSIVIDNSQL